MAKRDPDKSARNRIVENIKKELRQIVPDVLKATGLTSEQSLNSTIGSKNDLFFDLQNDGIHSHEEFINRWFSGLKTSINESDSIAHNWIYTNLQNHDIFKRYLILFLKRSYLKHFDELSKNRPKQEYTEIWIGQTNANYGLLVTPRFQDGQWENDKSEIRAFTEGYWTIGHILKTGLVIPSKNEKITFSDVDQYLIFFKNVLVRNSGSDYEYQIAEHYVHFVKSAPNPLSVPLMIPEFRYLGLEKKHKFRLDFLIINPYTLDKIGFELSPWSSHGYLSKIKELTQKEINKIAQDNFEKEMSKHRSFFKKHEIFTLIYTDESLQDCKNLFNNEIMQYLQPEKPTTQLSFQIMEEFL